MKNVKSEMKSEMKSEIRNMKNEEMKIKNRKKVKSEKKKSIQQKQSEAKENEAKKYGKLLAKAIYEKQKKGVNRTKEQQRDIDYKKYIKKYNRENITAADIYIENGKIKAKEKLFGTKGGWKEGKRWCITKTEWQKWMEKKTELEREIKLEKISGLNEPERKINWRESDYVYDKNLKCYVKKREIYGKKNEIIILIDNNAGAIYAAETQKIVEKSGKEEIIISVKADHGNRKVKCKAIIPRLEYYDGEDKIKLEGKEITINEMTELALKNKAMVYKIVEMI